MNSLNESKRNYVHQCNLLKSYCDVLSGSCSNMNEFVELAEKLAENPLNNLMLDNLDSLNDASKVDSMTQNVSDFLRILKDVVELPFGKSNAEYIESFSQILCDAYENSYIENSYLSIPDDYVLARIQRILNDFTSLSAGEIEKEYLLLYNLFSSIANYINILNEVGTVMFTDLYSTFSKSMSNAKEKWSKILNENDVAYLQNWTNEDIYKRKERFLDLDSKISNDELRVCYQEMCDIYSSRYALKSLILQELCSNFHAEDVDILLKETFQKIDTVFFPEKILENTPEEEQKVLDDLFGDMV